MTHPILSPEHGCWGADGQMLSVNSGIAQSFNKHSLSAGHVPGTVLGAGLAEGSPADTATSPELPCWLGRWLQKTGSLSALVRVPKNHPRWQPSCCRRSGGGAGGLPEQERAYVFR